MVTLPTREALLVHQLKSVTWKRNHQFSLRTSVYLLRCQHSKVKKSKPEEPVLLFGVQRDMRVVCSSRNS